MTAQKPETSSPSADYRLPWLIVFLLYLGFGFTFSIAQPLARTPDESAHMQYVRFLAIERRFPVWEAAGGGEGGYESQHPPLYYAAAAAVYAAISFLPENWRWYSVRWFTLLIGAGLFWVARRYFMEFFGNTPGPALAATAAFMLTPLTLLYTCYANVDGPAVVWSCIILWLSTRVARGDATTRDRIVLGLAFGAGLLTKLTALAALPVITLAYAIDPSVDSARKWEQRRIRLLITLLGAALVAGWWYARNSAVYSSPFIHTTGRFGSGISLAAETGQGAWLLYYSLRETCLSLWAQRGWLPPGVVEVALYTLLTLLLLTAAWGTIRRRARAGEPGVLDPAPWLAALFFVTLIIGHQLQVWLVDYEFNAGGRYLLNGLMGLCALIVAGLETLRSRRVLLSLMVAALLAMDVVSAWRISAVLNPRYVPGWTTFQFPADYDPAYRRGTEQLAPAEPPRGGGD